MHVSEDEIWFPDLQHSNGTVYGIFSGRFEFRCDLNFFYHPFDQQNCFTSLFDPGYDDSEINFTLTHHEIDMGTFIKHGVWNITPPDAELFRYQLPDLQLA